MLASCRGRGRKEVNEWINENEGQRGGSRRKEKGSMGEWEGGIEKNGLGLNFLATKLQ